jgi:hypothetical protein
MNILARYILAFSVHQLEDLRAILADMGQALLEVDLNLRLLQEFV